MSLSDLSPEDREALAAGNRVRRSLNRERRRNVLSQRPHEKKDRGRERDAGYLAFLRRQPCACGCGAPAPSDAAHLRMASPERGKISTGMQVKPSDRFAVPLNRRCHEAQHATSERRWWGGRGLDPFAIADRLYAEYRGQP